MQRSSRPSPTFEAADARLCPSGCPTNHGGPRAAAYLGEDWLAIPPGVRPAWPSFLARHGRRDLADEPSPTTAERED